MIQARDLQLEKMQRSLKMKKDPEKQKQEYSDACQQ